MLSSVEETLRNVPTSTDGPDNGMTRREWRFGQGERKLKVRQACEPEENGTQILQRMCNKELLANGMKD